ncbi:FkbM family methyltransferase [Streptomyces sp. E11-3]|uniref:FkbM family methyltransferase n=1 Tax=Streptomyces sp. E11-3 TaxID=3110112 RepID=UPI0039803018
MSPSRPLPLPLLDRARALARRIGVDHPRHPHAPRSWPGPQLVQLLHRFAVDLVLDVGAGTGGYGTLLRRGGYHGRIVSFEPLGRPRAALHRTAADDERWSVLPHALGDPHGEQPTGDRRLDALWEEVVAPGERVFLKLDAQGQEAPVLHGTGEYVTECVGLQTGTSLGPVPSHEHGLLFNDTLEYTQRTLGLTLMSVVPGLSHPESGQLLRCDLVLFKDDGHDQAYDGHEQAYDDVDQAHDDVDQAHDDVRQAHGGHEQAHGDVEQTYAWSAEGRPTP